ncbi:MAG: bifunctional pyr operon transcriptional regulator/uracil phosphoribosyltransferase PyrR [Gammaproteobacteria bacterium]|nr:bifunctional pyr operon transcriptional regulator/uracil phosphoribosyltransferase PyrR [Gammaproteobacteria bacterium]MCW8911178.1 bifunctional pyr operon transcriptional regulator/uracil phosphoribosyltransferase PyrR [Gammaproteobacteria bacterium]MCW9004156.1 bifunctional pyr operon transcriptional regulator/uracil phosphoribosyltransferase PyrR [Gammaproteobacteria bacterium]MCW9056610.1 bifunctional pyr operon transcriptional regulator/uracil phosphoribosyltransferase PyrR [Gammaproteob
MTHVAKPDQLLEKLATDLENLLEHRGIDDPLMVGIHTGGAWLAERLHKLLKIKQPLATLDISFYRDDFSRIGMNPQVKSSQLPPQIENCHIVLIDDVLQSGRTIRAAMNELFDYGRPASITLACLIERSGRELPIQADVVGQDLELNDLEQIKLTGPEPLAWEIKRMDRTS